MSRAERILGRFPNHFEAARPGKLIGDVVTALSRDLNVQSAQIGAVRRSHRVREADTVQDLMRIGVLHGISTGEVDILTMRMVRIALRLAELRAAAAADQEAAIDALLTLWRLELAQDPLDFFAPLMRDGTPDPDPANAVAVILDAAAAASSYASRRRALSRRISDISAIHAQGNGTVRALLYGTANALDLDVSAVFHSEDRYVHAAEARDRIALVPALGSGVAEAVRGTEVFGIEENPRRRAQQDPALRTHAECFEIRRRGFEPAAMEISITPVMDRGIGPMVVNRDEGRGVGYANTVPPGKTLLFSENGRATIDGADVTAFAYGFEGAVFADDDRPTKADAVFDTSPFVVTTPPGSLDRGAIFPHTGPNIAMPSVEVGITHVGFFVQEAHFNLAANPPLRPVDLIVTPRSTVGFFQVPARLWDPSLHPARISPGPLRRWSALPGKNVRLIRSAF